jgi:hypothetical protein
MDWQNFSIETWIGIGSAGLSLLGALMSYLLAARQTRVNVESLKFTNDTAVIAWANRVVSAMSEGQELARLTELLTPDKFNERKLALAYGLSALVDEGRWYFPNTGKRDGDNDAPSAYRGHRQPILDFVVLAYEAVSALPEEGVEAALLEVRRKFVSDVQDAVDPQRRQWVMERFRKY